MPTSYTSLLGMALPVTGELSGTWGDTVNDYITQYVDASVAGTQTISGSQTAVTLTVTNGTSLTQVGSGSSGSAQYAVINCTGNPASLLTITAPASSRQYIILNSTSTSQSVKIVGAGPTTGVTLISGEKAIVAWNGSDFVKIATTASAAGSNTQVQYNSSGNLAGSANLTFDGTTLTAAGLSGPLGATTPSTVVATQVNITAQGDLRLEDTTGGQYVALQAPSTVASNVTFTLPGADGTNGQAIVTDGSGNLSFGSAGITTGKSIAMAMIFGF